MMGWNKDAMGCCTCHGCRLCPDWMIREYDRETGDPIWVRRHDSPREALASSMEAERRSAAFMIQDEIRSTLARMEARLEEAIQALRQPINLVQQTSEDPDAELDVRKALEAMRKHSWSVTPLASAFGAAGGSTVVPASLATLFDQVVNLSWLVGLSAEERMLMEDLNRSTPLEERSRHLEALTLYADWLTDRGGREGEAGERLRRLIPGNGDVLVYTIPGPDDLDDSATYESTRDSWMKVANSVQKFLATMGRQTFWVVIPANSSVSDMSAMEMGQMGWLPAAGMLALILPLFDCLKGQPEAEGINTIPGHANFQAAESLEALSKLFTRLARDNEELKRLKLWEEKWGGIIRGLEENQDRLFRDAFGHRPGAPVIASPRILIKPDTP